MDYGDGNDVVDSVPGGPFATIAVGWDVALAIRLEDGVIVAWGAPGVPAWGAWGEPVLTDVPVGRFDSLSTAGGTACGIRAEDRSITCWGDDSFGVISGVPDGAFSSVSASRSLGCAIRTNDGGIVCWGSESSWPRERGVPDVPGGFSKVSVNQRAACALANETSELFCWGAFTHNDDIPRGVALSDVSVGEAGCCGIRRRDGQLLCWAGDTRWEPYGLDDVPAGRFLSVSAGELHICAVRVDGEVICWGSDREGQVSGDDPLLGPTECGALDGCAPGYFCDFYAADTPTCGGHGLCEPNPAETECDGSVDLVCTCAGVLADNACLGRVAGADIAPATMCTPPAGMFACVDTFCTTGTSYCFVDVFAREPATSASCVALPSACPDATCACLVGEVSCGPGGTFSCSDDGAGGATITCVEGG